MTLTLSPLFSTGMVLQRDCPIPLTGTAPPRELVSVSFLGETRTAQADQNGRWSLTLGPYPYGGPYIMEIRSGGETRLLEDILIGELWLLGGQSNLQLPMERVRHMFPWETQQKQFPLLRLFRVPDRFSLAGPQAQITGGSWEAPSPESLPAFSAAGYFFGKALWAQLQIPIGLISAAIGGTPIQTWMGRDMLAPFPALLEESRHWENRRDIDQIKAREAARTAAYYADLDRRDRGLWENWAAPDFDDSSWDEAALDAPWDPPLQAPGVIWLRKTLRIPKHLAGQPAAVFLGTITDGDTLYVNGQAIGSTGYRYPPREYQIPALTPGTCTLALRVLNLRGQGEITPGKLRMLTAGSASFDLNSPWRLRRGCESDPYQPESYFGGKPAAYFNGMIAPLCRYPIKGLLWYQGESDCDAPAGYQEKFSAMLRGWRSLWGTDFPVIFAQLPEYNRSYGADWERMRTEQVRCLQNKNTAMIYTRDVGEYNDLHPQNKQAIGQRFAQAALILAYGKAFPPSPFLLFPEPEED